jgi:hypothetical protein
MKIWQAWGMVSGDAIVTGAVGVAGIVGTLVGAWLTPWLSGRSQSEQARHADKRQVYATCLASFEKMIRPIEAYCATVPNTKRREEARTPLNTANDGTFVAVSELKLIAPKVVSDRAEEIDRFFQKIIDNPPPGGFTPGEPPDGYKSLRDELLKMMRVDLGELAE